jgi:hypothetical protein
MSTLIDDAYYHWLADLMAEAGDYPKERLLLYAAGFRHVAADGIQMLTEDGSWQRAYARLQEEVSRRGLGEEFEDFYHSVRPFWLAQTAPLRNRFGTPSRN